MELRIAWRALTLAGLCGDQLLGTLQEVLEHERAHEEIFATLCTVGHRARRTPGRSLPGRSPGAAGRRARPAAAAAAVRQQRSGARGAAGGPGWPRTQVELGAEWSLMLYTDGLIEGHVGAGRERLGEDGMLALVRAKRDEGLRGEALLRATVDEVRRLNGGELADDVAVISLDRGR
ncbi:Response regulatory domain-containing protein OS=Streptomyces fumanus OX=67302 GN=GCM10018772_29680 PE=4 SV=1 [Streptomyces fumanus]